MRRVILALLLAAPVGCHREASVARPFEGARPVELACVKENRPPTRAELEPLVRALIDVAGGRTRLSRLAWRRVEDLYLQASGDPESNHARVTTNVRTVDLSMRTLLEYRSGQTEMRVLWKNEEYLAVRGVPLAVALGGNKQFVEWDYELAQLPVWLDVAASLTPLPSRVIDGRAAIGIHVEVEGWNPPFDCWIDAAGPMIVTVEADLPITGDLSLHTVAKQRIRYSDFRRVDGLLFAFRRDIELDGRRFALAETREITTDVAFSDADFLPK